MTSELVGLIPAAGRGVRAYPYTATVPKCMLEVDGVPLLERNIGIMRDQLGIRDIVVVLGHRGDVIRRRFGDGGALGVDLRYVVNDRLDLELCYSIYLGGRSISRYCCVILADECYVGSNHRDLLETPYRSALATCGVITSEYAKHIRKNYVVALQDGCIVGMVEKPKTVTSALMGTGTYLVSPDIFRRLEAVFEPMPTGPPRDWTTWLGEQARGGAPIRAFRLTGGYVNINSRDDLNYANSLVREAIEPRRTTSLVYLAEGDDDAITKPLRRFGEVPSIDEIVVVTRTRSPALERLGAERKVRVVTAPTPEFPIGDLLRLGMDEATSDVMVLAYSDDTFAPRDVAKFLVYLNDADLVIGTRTTRQMIEQGTNMRGIVRAAHLLLAKLVQILWWRFEPRFTDVCCVYRAIWRSTYETIRPNLSATGVEAYPEMVAEVLRARRRVIEIPINYLNRDLHDRYVRSPYQSMTTFRRIASLLIRKRLYDSPLRRWVGRADASSRPDDEAERREFRARERAWQNDHGYALLDKPHDAPGSAAVFDRQADRLIALIDPRRPGLIVEIGCGRGHFLSRLRAVPDAPARTLVGIDISRAIFALPERGLLGIQGDGEALPLRSATAAYVIYDGSLHHCIDYPGALREAMRVLAPGGSLIIFEPVSSRFSRLAHRLLDPIIFRNAGVYESPIDIRYKAVFDERVIADVVRAGGLSPRETRSDFLAYPFTGCYASSRFSRSLRFMRWLMALEDRVAATPFLRRVATAFAWRFTIVATKPGA